MNFPALDMGELDRVRSLFTPSEWRRHKRSLRVYEGYLGFQYMGKETDGEWSVNAFGLRCYRACVRSSLGHCFSHRLVKEWLPAAQLLSW
jgi:hypothetical protein